MYWPCNVSQQRAVKAAGILPKRSLWRILVREEKRDIQDKKKATKADRNPRQEAFWIEDCKVYLERHLYFFCLELTLTLDCKLVAAMILWPSFWSSCLLLSKSLHGGARGLLLEAVFLGLKTNPHLQVRKIFFKRSEIFDRKVMWLVSIYHSMKALLAKWNWKILNFGTFWLLKQNWCIMHVILLHMHSNTMVKCSCLTASET